MQSTNQLITEARLGDRPAGLLTHELPGDEAARNLAGFDFDDTWTVGNTTGSYPSLVANRQRPEPRTNATTDDLYAGGNGTAADPYRIANWHHLDNVRKNRDANFTLVASLDETTAGYDAVAGPNATQGIGFYPIGDTTTPFVGTFDGDGHRIVGLTIDASTERSVGLYEQVGLFGRIGPDGTVRNVSLTAPYVTSSFGTVGGLVGHNGGTISNVSVRATVEDGGFIDIDAPDLRSMGGLAGTNNGTIEHVSATTTIVGGRSVGGLVGAVTVEREDWQDLTAPIERTPASTTHPPPETPTTARQSSPTDTATTAGAATDRPSITAASSSDGSVSESGMGLGKASPVSAVDLAPHRQSDSD